MTQVNIPEPNQATKDVRADLRRMRDSLPFRDGGRVFKRGDGICDNLLFINPWSHSRTTLIIALHRAFQDWPDFSGDTAYPVSVRSYKDESAAHEEYHTCEDKWDTSTPYGAKRVELLDWLIDNIVVED